MITVARTFSVALAITVLLAGCAAAAPEPTATVEAAPSQKPVAPTPTPDTTWADPEEGRVLDNKEIATALPGYWVGDWGEILFRIDADGTVVGAYNYDEGIVIGHLEGAVMTGWWCEVPSREPDIDAGSVQ